MIAGESVYETDLLVIGGGPGGYHAAFRAAENGISTTIVEASGALGGVCLHCGCIPSKTYLSMAELLHRARSCGQMGIEFTEPKLDVEKMRAWKHRVVSTLSGGLDVVCKKKGIRKIKGKARFEGNNVVAIEDGDVSHITFHRSIIATGSRPIRLRNIEIESPRVVDSTGALDLEDIPETLLVLGGGYIGLELGQVYANFGSKVTVVEMLPGLLPGADRDLVRPLARRLKEQFSAICLETKVVGMKEAADGVEVEFEGKRPPELTKFAKVLVSVGRQPCTDGSDLDKAGVETDGRGFIKTDKNFRTTASDIYAIGDVIGDPMLAHKALHEGTVLGDRLAGKDVVFGSRVIPAVVFTDPEIAWVGITEEQAKAEDRDIVVTKIPWQVSGRAVTLGATLGTTKLIFDKGTRGLIGMAITGAHAGEMIAEGALAIETGATASDLASTVHPHPTLSEMVGEAARMAIEAF